MNQENQQSAGTPAGAGEQAAPISARGAARRRFTRAGLGVSGALVTISSRAGMNVEICKAPSGSMSGGLKSHHGPPPVCEGRSPGYWKTHSHWPCSAELTYGSVFSCSPYSKYHGCKMKDMLDPKKWDKQGIGRHLVATYLNVLSGKISFLTVASIQGIWRELQLRGYYSPTAGVKWYAADVVKYLAGTMS